MIEKERRARKCGDRKNKSEYRIRKQVRERERQTDRQKDRETQRQKDRGRQRK